MTQELKEEFYEPVFGERVNVSKYLVRKSAGTKSNDTFKYWRDKECGTFQGICIGVRTLSHGYRVFDSEEGYTYKPSTYFTAYLIAFSMHAKPVFVRPEHIRAVQYPRKDK